MKKKTVKPKKYPQEFLDAQWAVDSAVVRGEDKEVIFALRMRRDELKKKYSIQD